MRPESGLKKAVADAPAYSDFTDGGIKLQRYKVSMTGNLSDKAIFISAVRSRDWSKVDGWFYEHRYNNSRPEKFYGLTFNPVGVSKEALRNHPSTRPGKMIAHHLKKMYIVDDSWETAVEEKQKTVDKIAKFFEENKPDAQGYDDYFASPWEECYTSGQSGGNRHRSLFVYLRPYKELYHIRFNSYVE